MPTFVFAAGQVTEAPAGMSHLCRTRAISV